MTQYLPPNLLALFAARDPIPYMTPVDKLPHEKKTRGYIGVGQFLGHFENPDDTPAPKRVETRQERLDRRRREKAEQIAYKLEREIALWDPLETKNATEDPFRTLFVARINYDTSESKLRREFEIYGPIKKIVMINDHETGRPKGYAFIEYEHERDMHAAYKHADGKKIDGKRVLVDVERARTVKGWLPRRLGGGLGGTRRGGNDVNIKHSGREDNERERERYRLEREREDRENTRILERSRFDSFRRRSRSRERRDRGKRSRSRSREKRKRRGFSKDRDFDDSKRERDRERKKKRSKSRERESPREKREKKRERRDKERDRDIKERKPDFQDMETIKIKEEPIDDGYPIYPLHGYSSAGIKREIEDDEEKYVPPLNMYNVPLPQTTRKNDENGDTLDNAQKIWWR